MIRFSKINILTKIFISEDYPHYELNYLTRNYIKANYSLEHCEQLMQIISLYIFNDDSIRIRFQIKEEGNRNNSNLRKISDFVIYCYSIPLIHMPQHYY